MTETSPLNEMAAAEDSGKAQPSKRQRYGLPQTLGAFFAAGFVLSLAIDILFWQQPLGWSYLIWVGLVLAGALVLCAIEKQRPRFGALLLMLGALFMAFLAVWRAEPGTRAYAVLLSIVLMGFAADSLLTGGMLRMRLLEAALRLFLTAFAAIERPIAALLALGGQRKENGNPGSWRKTGLPILRGVLIALPVLLIFSALLASADPMFGKAIGDFFEWFKIDDWGEFVFRVFYIVILGFAFSGLLLHALSTKPRFQQKDGAIVKPFVGQIESATVLTLVVLLLGVFLAVQFRYFFGGESNINYAGYTYAEYARKGAEELIFLSVLALGLVQLAHGLTKTNDARGKFFLRLLSTLLIAEILVILYSSFVRVQLYEEAYGFTRIRLRTHVFIYWLAALLALTMLMEWLGKSERFFGVLLAVSFGFVATQGLLNLDAHILQQNLARDRMDGEKVVAFDHAYLNMLSDDAVPGMLDALKDSSLSAEAAEGIAAELNCRAWQISEEEPLPWYAHAPAEQTARGLLAGYEVSQPELDEWEQAYVPLSNGELHYCLNSGW